MGMTHPEDAIDSSPFEMLEIFHTWMFLFLWNLALVGVR